jgi:DNA-directed RNA polymerase specialized sigma24 family protein
MAKDALRRAYAEHRLALVRLATLLTRREDIAEDFVHDVFLRVEARLHDLMTLRPIRTCVVRS